MTTYRVTTWRRIIELFMQLEIVLINELKIEKELILIFWTLSIFQIEYCPSHQVVQYVLHKFKWQMDDRKLDLFSPGLQYTFNIIFTSNHYFLKNYLCSKFHKVNTKFFIIKISFTFLKNFNYSRGKTVI